MARNWVFVTLFGFVLAGIFFSGMWCVYGRVVKHVDGPTRGKDHNPFWRRSKFSFWRRLSLKGHDYELLREYQERLEA
jgi:hypothetical protein